MRAHGIRILSFDARIQLLVVLLVAFPFSARAGDCGMPTPDYKAERTVTVGDRPRESSMSSEFFY
jgi:hypothetical protein